MPRRASGTAAEAQRVITELQPATGYSIAVSTSAGTQTVTVSPGGSTTSSAQGVLRFNVSAAGSVSP